MCRRGGENSPSENADGNIDPSEDGDNTEDDEKEGSSSENGESGGSSGSEGGNQSGDEGGESDPTEGNATYTIGTYYKAAYFFSSSTATVSVGSVFTSGDTWGSTGVVWGYLTLKYYSSSSSQTTVTIASTTGNLTSYSASATLTATERSGYTFLGFWTVTDDGEDSASYWPTACLSNSSTYTLTSDYFNSYIVGFYRVGASSSSDDCWYSHYTAGTYNFASGNYGSGTSSSPYQISTVYMLAYLAYKVNSSTSTHYSGTYFKLTCNLDMSQYVWIPIGGHTYSGYSSSSTSYYFSGYFDGGGYMIDGLTTSTSSTMYIGLFGYCIGANIHDLIIGPNCDFNGYGHVGSVCGYITSNSTYTSSYIQNIGNYSDVSVSSTSGSSGTGIGGIVGYASVTYSGYMYIRYCYNFGTVYGSTASYNGIGGIVGVVYSGYTAGSGITTYAYVYDCANYGIVYTDKSLYSYVGGIIGRCYQGVYYSGSYSYSYIYVYRCYNQGDVYNTASYGYRGGIIGGTYTSPTSTGTDYGAIHLNIYNCLNTSTPSVLYTYNTRGLIGYCQGQTDIGMSGLRMYRCWFYASGTYSGHIYAIYGVSGSSSTFGYASSTLWACSDYWYYSSSYLSSASGISSFLTGGSTYWSTTYPWSVSTSATATSYTWICGNSSVNSSYPMLRWCFTYTALYSYYTTNYSSFTGPNSTGGTFSVSYYSVTTTIGTSSTSLYNSVICSLRCYSVTFSASAKSGYKFIGLMTAAPTSSNCTSPSSCTTTSSALTITAGSNATYYAVFVRYYTSTKYVTNVVTADKSSLSTGSSSAGGTISWKYTTYSNSTSTITGIYSSSSLSSSYYLLYNGTSTFTVTSTYAGYKFLGWYGASSSVSAFSSLTALSTSTTYSNTQSSYQYIYAVFMSAYWVNINVYSPSGSEDYASGTFTVYYSYDGSTHSGVSNEVTVADGTASPCVYGETIKISNISPATGTYLSSYSYSGGTMTESSGTYTFTCTGTGEINFYMAYYLFAIDINIYNPSGVQDYASGTISAYYSYYGTTYTGLSNEYGSSTSTSVCYYGQTIVVSNISPAAGYCLSSVTCDNGSISETSTGVWTYTATMTSAPSGGYDANIKIYMANASYTVYFEESTHITIGTTFTAYNSSGSGSVSVENNEVVRSFTFSTVSTSSCGYYLSVSPSLTSGTTYSWSMYVKSTVAHTLNTVGSEQNGTKSFSVTTSWTRVAYTFTATDTTYKAFTFYSTSYSSGETLYIKNLTLQVASEYTGDYPEGALTVTYSGTYTNLPTPTRTGYTFSSWNTASDGSGTTITSSSTVSITSAQTLYAQWTANTYSLTYNANGGTVNSASTYSDYVRYADTYGKTNLYNPSLCNLTSNISLSSNIFTASITSTSTSTQYINFFQTYTSKYATNTTYTVVLEIRSISGSGNLNFSSPTDAGESDITTAKASIAMSSTGVYTTTFTTKSSYTSDVVHDFRSYIAVSAGNTLTATFRISVFAGFITTSGSFSYASYGSMPSSNVLPTPTRTGYTFSGWNTASDGSGTTIISSSIVSIVTDQILYAQWTANSYTLTLNANGGTYSSSYSGYQSSTVLQHTVTYASGSWNDESGRLPTRTSYTFAGYYTAASGGTQVYSSGGVSVAGSYWTAANGTWCYDGDVTLYAHWTAKTVSIYIRQYVQSALGSTTYSNAAGGTVGYTRYYNSSSSVATQSTTTSAAAPSAITVLQQQVFSVTSVTSSSYTYVGMTYSTTGTTSDITSSSNSSLLFTATAGEPSQSLKFTPGSTTIYIYVFYNRVSANQLKYDSTEGYWYFEDGVYPQSYAGTSVSGLSSTVSYTLSIAGQTVNVYSNGSNYYAKVTAGSKTAYFLVEPIRWVVAYGSSYPSGWTTYASYSSSFNVVSAYVLSYGAVESDAVSEGWAWTSSDLYTATNSNASSSTKISLSYSSSASKSYYNFNSADSQTVVSSTTTTVSNAYYTVASTSDLTTVAGRGSTSTYRAKATDLVAFLASSGSSTSGDSYTDYWTRDLSYSQTAVNSNGETVTIPIGNTLGNGVYITATGRAGTSALNVSHGVRFSYTCSQASRV